MADLREDVIKKLEEERKKKEEELKNILKEIEEKSNQLKKEKEIEEMIKEMELQRKENSEDESLDEEAEEKKIEEELTLNYDRPLTNLYKSNEENSLYNISLTTMQNVYETAKSLSQASREGKLSENELNVISNLEETLEGTNQNYIPSERAVMLLKTSKSILNEIRKYNS